MFIFLFSWSVNSCKALLPPPGQGDLFDDHNSLNEDTTQHNWRAFFASGFTITLTKTRRDFSELTLSNSCKMIYCQTEGQQVQVLPDGWWWDHIHLKNNYVRCYGTRHSNLNFHFLGAFVQNRIFITRSTAFRRYLFCCRAFITHLRTAHDYLTINYNPAILLLARPLSSK
jgi:hypothetical protein